MVKGRGIQRRRAANAVARALEEEKKTKAKKAPVKKEEAKNDG